MEKINVGVIGCGTISETYLKNLTEHFDNLQVTACADIFLEKAAASAKKYGIPKACTVEELLADEAITLVANLTIPAVHYEVNMQILNAGKNLYCEKPLALNYEQAKEIAALAEEKGLLVTAAPDTFLGAGVQTGRWLIDEGVLGDIVGFTANMVTPGVDLWHPNPTFYYKKGGGPVWDMAPYYLTALVAMFGPIRQVYSMARKCGEVRHIYENDIEIEVPTTYAGVLEFANGIIGNVNMSFDVWNSKLPCLEVYGTQGSMEVPDPNMFNGDILLCSGKEITAAVAAVKGGDFNVALERWLSSTVESTGPVKSPFPAEAQPRSNMRGIGLSEMAAALLSGRDCRLSAALSCHVMEAMEAFDVSARENRPYVMQSTCTRPAPMPSDCPLWSVG